MPDRPLRYTRKFRRLSAAPDVAPKAAIPFPRVVSANDSTADAFQLRGVDLQRFDTAGPLGAASEADREQITAAVTLIQ